MQPRFNLYAERANEIIARHALSDIILFLLYLNIAYRFDRASILLSNKETEGIHDKHLPFQHARFTCTFCCEERNEDKYRLIVHIWNVISNIQ